MKTETILAFAFGAVALTMLFVIAIFGDPNPLLITVSRVTLALACAGIAVVLPGIIDVDVSPTSNLAIRAGGALAVLVLVYFFNPPTLLTTSTTDKIPDPPTSDFTKKVDSWLEIVDSGDYETAYKEASPSLKESFSQEQFATAISNYIKPLGALQERTLSGYRNFTRTPDGRVGQFRTADYKTIFENGPEQFEQVAVEAIDDEWRVFAHVYFPMPYQGAQ
ncbi:MAG: DUF4019 domain-containing protein [Gammaproteobacteria bacterium]|nr:DUF4019 domain-containing protein [Gammaproteobacteria bacterium]